MIAQDVWLLGAECGPKYLSLVGWGGLDENYWGKYFVGQEMPDDWELPKLEILGKRNKLGDFVGWALQAPVVSEKTKISLERLIQDYVQFLPFHSINGKPYFAVNVTNIVDCLDTVRSEGQRDHDGRLITYHRYVFKENCMDSAPIFKVSPTSAVFVNKLFAETLIANQLTGASLEAPSENSLSKLASGQSLNVYPGLR